MRRTTCRNRLTTILRRFYPVVEASANLPPPLTIVPSNASARHSPANISHDDCSIDIHNKNYSMSAPKDACPFELTCTSTTNVTVDNGFPVVGICFCRLLSYNKCYFIFLTLSLMKKKSIQCYALYSYKKI